MERWKVYREAAKLIAEPGAWCQNSAARDLYGVPVDPTSPAAEQWCMIGAVESLGTIPGLVLERVCGLPPAQWNDRANRKQRTVVAKLHEASNVVRYSDPLDANRATLNEWGPAC